MRWIVLVVLARAVLGPTTAEACPPGRPCHKYQPRPPAVVRVPPTAYLHTVKGAPPRFERGRVSRYLRTGRWKPVYAKPVAVAIPTKRPSTRYVTETDALRFVDPTRTIPDDKEGERIVLVRSVEKKQATGITLVDVDGEIFQLTTCKMWPRYACLVPSDVGFDEVEPAAEPAPSP